MNYGTAVQDRVANARFRGDLERETVRAEATNPVCGDVVVIAMEVRDGRIVAARWKAHGCPPTLAAADVLVELVEGRTVVAAQAIAKADLLGRLPGLPATSGHAADVALEALHKALQAFD